MARIRTIKPEFPQSESMGRVSRDARLLFVQLWTLCDDEGRTRAASRMLASLLFPYDDDAPGLIDGWLAELEHENCIVRYIVDGCTYLQVCNWLNHQKIDHASKSKIPPPDESSRILANPREPSWLDQGSRIKEGIKEGIKEKPLARSRVRDSGPPVLTIPTVGPDADTPIYQPLIDELGQAFPSVDVMAELRKARAWVISNPTRRKTARGLQKFLFAWVERANNGARSGGGYRSRQAALEAHNAAVAAAWVPPEQRKEATLDAE